jgi:hypothetical protein
MRKGTKKAAVKMQNKTKLTKQLLIDTEGNEKK